jgi:hypothetical protein
MNHPTQGHTQLFRRDLSESDHRCAAAPVSRAPTGPAQRAMLSIYTTSCTTCHCAGRCWTTRVHTRARATRPRPPPTTRGTSEQGQPRRTRRGGSDSAALASGADRFGHHMHWGAACECNVMTQHEWFTRGSTAAWQRNPTTPHRTPRRRRHNTRASSQGSLQQTAEAAAQHRRCCCQHALIVTGQPKQAHTRTPCRRLPCVAGTPARAPCRPALRTSKDIVLYNTRHRPLACMHTRQWPHRQEWQRGCARWWLSAAAYTVLAPKQTSTKWG